MTADSLSATIKLDSDPNRRPPLTPLLHGRIRNLLDAGSGAIFPLVTQYGSPLNIVFPEVVEENVRAIQKAIEPYQVAYSIFFGAKASKSNALLKAAVRAGAGVDVSSAYELRDALAAGAMASAIGASGPAKTTAFHRSLIALGALISIDSPEELSDLETIDSAEPVRILLRYRPVSASASRFGIAGERMRASLLRLAGLRDRFSFEGFHFHVSGYDVIPRVAAVKELVPLISLARSLGIPAAIVDIGGGMPVRYVDPGHYDTFQLRHSATDYVNGRLPKSLYPYGGTITAQNWIHRFLEAECVAGVTVAGYLRSETLKLVLEPGRCAVDQAAISIFRVTRTKACASGDAVFVEGSSFSACETWFNSEFLVDPVVLKGPGHRAGRGGRAFIAGHSCLEEDVITYRLIDFESLPAPGDLLVFANTAGYQMDLLENEFHRHPMPRRIVMTFDHKGQRIVADDDGAVPCR